MPKGIITCTSSNLYQVNSNQREYHCLARGKLKKDNSYLLPGDLVEITITDEGKQEGVLEEVLPRKNELKRPKMANLTQLIFVVSMKMPKPDLLLLDKQLAYANFIGVKSIICFNKIDLETEKVLQEIVRRYEKLNYLVITTNAKEKGEGKKIVPLLQGNITAFAGNSGVGKSTLINSIFKKELTRRRKSK